MRRPSDIPVDKHTFLPSGGLRARSCDPKRAHAPEEKSHTFVDVFKSGVLGVLSRLLSNASARTPASSESCGHH